MFFANSGSEANDSQIKMLRYYFNVTGRPQKIIALERSYHGVTMVAAAQTGLPVMHTHFDAAVGDPARFHLHYYHGQQDGESEAAFVARLVNELEQLIEREGADTIAAFIAEPIGGAAGVVVAPDSYYPAVQEVLKARHPVLGDEVICGFGRTGKTLAQTPWASNLI